MQLIVPSPDLQADFLATAVTIRANDGVLDSADSRAGTPFRRSGVRLGR